MARTPESRQHPFEHRRQRERVTGAVLGGAVAVPSFHGLPISRLDQLLAKAWRHRLTLIIAPAGSGKTTLAARFAATSPTSVGWYRAETWDRQPERMVHRLEMTLRSALEDMSGGWETVDDMLDELWSRGGDPCLLVIDDLHALESTGAEEALELILDHLPSWLTVIVASRVPPNFNLPRLRLSGDLLEIRGDELRMRTWEVERLFQDFYGQRLPPEELAYLARRTEGWAAGLQLFHLATKGKTPGDRRRLLYGLRRGSGVMRDYLARNVLCDLPDELSRFLIESSVLGKLTGPLCDRLLQRHGSNQLLDELEERCLFTYALPEQGAFRYHEVFRSHLLGVLLETYGEAEARRRHRLAGQLLADESAIPEALDAFCRGEAWQRVDQLLGRDRGEATHSMQWMDALPAALVRNDPWLVLSLARSHRAQGRLTAAVEAYSNAERAFGRSDGGAMAHEERHTLTSWVRAEDPVTTDPWDLLRAATRRDPVAAHRDLSAVGGSGLARGLAALLSGRVREARANLLETAEDPEASVSHTIAASLSAGIAGVLGGDVSAVSEVEGAVGAADDAGLEWLTRIGRAALALDNGGESWLEADLVGRACSALGDDWGAALCDLIVGWAAGDTVRGRETLERAGDAFRDLGAPVLEAWALALNALALVHAEDPGAKDLVLRAEATARMTGTPAARQFAYEALARLRDDALGDYGAVLIDARLETGINLPSWATPDAPDEEPSEEPRYGAGPTMRLRCFGGLELSIEGRGIKPGTLRPRVGSLLRLLCADVGKAVHEEVIQEALWPNTDPETGSRNLQVAVSTLRRVLEPQGRRGSFQVLLREGHSYRLAVNRGSDVDLVRFDEAVSAARAAIGAGDHGPAERAYSQALHTYGGELLADEGPVDWLVEPRERRRQQAVEAAHWVASACLQRGDLAGASQACADGLRVDRYHDPLWRTLIEARERAGDRGTAQRVRSGYAAVLAELGVTVGDA